MKKYINRLRLQLFFLNSLLKDLELHESFLKEHLKLDDRDYKNLINKVVALVSLEEHLMRMVKNKTRVNSVGKNDILVIYNQLNDLYTFYKPYHDANNLLLRGINVCFTNPLYWYEKMIDSFK